MRVADLIKALEQFNPDAMVIIEAHNHRETEFSEDTPSDFFEISDIHPTYVVTSRDDSTSRVKFMAVGKHTDEAREVVFIEATNQF